MSTTTTTMAAMLAAVYPNLKAGTDYTMSADGTEILTWAPRQKGLGVPQMPALQAAYATWVAKSGTNAKLQAATQAVDAFWASLTDAQKVPLLTAKAAMHPLNVDTGAKVLLLIQLAGSETGLTAPQQALLTAAHTAVNALAS